MVRENSKNVYKLTSSLNILCYSIYNLWFLFQMLFYFSLYFLFKPLNYFLFNKQVQLAVLIFNIIHQHISILLCRHLMRFSSYYPFFLSSVVKGKGCVYFFYFLFFLSFCGQTMLYPMYYSKCTLCKIRVREKNVTKHYFLNWMLIILPWLC